MSNLYFSILFLALAAACNASMDVVSFHYDKSIFKNLKRQYFDPSLSWRNKYIKGNPDYGRKTIFWTMVTLHPAFTDFWHLMKSLMVIFICIALLFPLEHCIKNNYFNLISLFVIYGFIWNMVFNLFYNKILKK